MAASGVFDWFVPLLETVGPTRIETDRERGPSCVYTVETRSKEAAVCYLSTVLPWAVVLRWNADLTFGGFGSLAASDADVARLCAIMSAAGFNVVGEFECSQVSPYANLQGGNLTYFELVFDEETHWA
ncbi:hypothetical protein [Actinotalea solisilvae]|uniref:hypothetical protein n=1 Tax=Actinotalea solisilvae TaxID=2072922 RepID=UPI0018F274F9|nr:hypothetical protein [Actinotalea solisilvae]